MCFQLSDIPSTLLSLFFRHPFLLMLKQTLSFFRIYSLFPHVAIKVNLRSNKIKLYVKDKNSDNYYYLLFSFSKVSQASLIRIKISRTGIHQSPVVLHTVIRNYPDHHLMKASKKRSKRRVSHRIASQTTQKAIKKIGNNLMFLALS